MRTIYAHIHREPNVKYLEDTYTQYEINHFTASEINDIFEKNNNEVYICWETFLNTVGLLVEGNEVQNDFVVVTKEFTAKYTSEGYLDENWEIAYMLYGTYKERYI